MPNNDLEENVKKELEKIASRYNRPKEAYYLLASIALSCQDAGLDADNQIGHASFCTRIALRHKSFQIKALRLTDTKYYEAFSTRDSRLSHFPYAYEAILRNLNHRELLAANHKVGDFSLSDLERRLDSYLIWVNENPKPKDRPKSIREKRSMHKWTNEEVSSLLEGIKSGMSLVELAQKMKRSTDGVTFKIRVLAKEKPDLISYEIAKEYVRQRNRIYYRPAH